MGVGGEKKPMREIAATKGYARDEAFENIIQRIKQTPGSEIIKDETFPLYTEVGQEQFEIGTERMVEFNVNKMDFKLSRRVENYILQGAGIQKHLEELTPPRIKIILKKKAYNTNDWQIIDLDDMF